MANANGFEPIPFPSLCTEDDSSEEEEDLIAAYMLGMLPLSPAGTNGPRYSVPRVHVRRNIREGWHALRADHFDHDKVYPDTYFRRR